MNDKWASYQQWWSECLLKFTHHFPCPSPAMRPLLFHRLCWFDLPRNPLGHWHSFVGICRILLFPQVSGAHSTFDLYFSMRGRGNFPTAVNLTKRSPQKTERQILNFNFIQFPNYSDHVGSLHDSTLKIRRHQPLQLAEALSARQRLSGIPPRCQFLLAMFRFIAPPKKEKKRKIVTLI